MKITKIPMVGSTTLLGVLMLAACTPGDVQYCRRFGVENTPEYGTCLSYYHQQDAAFDADASLCNIEADGIYPPYLYDYGHDVPVPGYFAPRGLLVGGGIEHVPPDYLHNAQVDDLRMRIIAPCMAARGWNSPTTWQAGRHAVSVKPKTTPQKMPWQ